MSADSVSICIRGGGLYMSAVVCDRYFAGVEAVVLLRPDDDVVVLPVRHAAAGGYLLKRRNAAGDRVVFAPEFFLSHGLGDDVNGEFAAHWDDNRAALVVSIH
jgi:hypothetical protein